MNNLENDYNELSFYTLSHKDLCFIHQHIVDAQIAQTANENTKPISLVFSLVGLFLLVEQGLSGRQIQQFHLKMSKQKRIWPTIILPLKRGEINVSFVLSCSPGDERDEMIQRWCETIWDAYKANREIIKNLIEQF